MNLTIQFPQDTKAFKMFRYPGGEVQVRLTSDVAYLLKHPRIQTVDIVARIHNGDLMPLLQLVNAVRGTTSADIRVILPYLPYGRADRRFVVGDTLALQVLGQMLNTMAGVEIITLDVHSAQAEKYIRHFTNVSAATLINQVLNEIEGEDNVASVLLPDDGANRYKFEYPFRATKKRDPETGKLYGFEVPDKSYFLGDSILIVDDICDGGGTFVGIADALQESGNTLPLYLYVTHGIFSQGFTNLFKKFEKVYTTDSFGIGAYAAPEDQQQKLVVLPCLPTILEQVSK